MPVVPVPSSDAPLVPAGLERRFAAYAIDRIFAWVIAAGVGYAVWRLLEDPQWWLVGLAVWGTLVLIGLIGAVLLGVNGTSPGKAMMGLRVRRTGEGRAVRPIGVGPAVLRMTVLGIAGLPTLGLGVATLGWTAAADPDGTRRAWHDRFGDAVVVDVRPQPVEPEVDVDEGPQPVVNLTAARLRPAASPERPHVEAPVPAEGRSPVPPPSSSPPPDRQPERQPDRAQFPPASAPQRPAAVPRTAPPELVGTQLRSPAPGSHWRVTFDTGETFLVDGLALIGRRPEPREGEPVRHVVPLRSDDMSLSKTHAQFQVVPDGALVVMDRGSTNGSQVLRRGLAKPLSPGRPSTLIDGDVVRFGDRSMRVTREG